MNYKKNHSRDHSKSQFYHRKVSESQSQYIYVICTVIVTDM